MLILEAIDIEKSFGERTIFTVDKLQIFEGDRIGLTGINGAGKTTLLNILAGCAQPDKGIVKQYCEITYIKQFSSETLMADGEQLSRFELSNKDTNGVLSGGERTRLKLASSFSSGNQPVLLLADEPTANLDFKARTLLKKKLMAIPSMVLISHDRDLLDALCTQIIEVHEGRINQYPGNYTDYRLFKERQEKRSWDEYKGYVTQKKHLETAMADKKRHATKMTKPPRRMGSSEWMLYKGVAKQQQKNVQNEARNIQKRLDRLEVKEKPKKQSQVKMDFSLTQPPSNKVVVAVTQLDVAYGKKSIFHCEKAEIPNHKKTAIIGENGTGKTSFLNAIYHNESGVRVVPQAKIGYFYQQFDNIDLNQTVIDNVMFDSVQSMQTARSILASLLIRGEDVFKQAGVLSGGERIKLSLAKLFVSDANVLFLDEPTNYLDIHSIEALGQMLKDYEGTVVFVSHDAQFVSEIADRLLIIKDKQITAFEGPYNSYQESLKQSLPAADLADRQLLLETRLAALSNELIKPLSSDQKAELEKTYFNLTRDLKALKEGALHS